MLKTAPLYAAVLVLCACTSAPTVKFPTGSATRVAINNSAKPVAASAGAAAQSAPLSRASVATIVASQGANAPAVKEAPPEPFQLKVYLVNASEQSVLAVLRRWARTTRIDFTWDSEMDYPLTARMRAIDARDLDGALEQMRDALVGVRQPLLITNGTDGLVVQNGEVLPSPPEPVAAPAVDSAAAPAQPVAAVDIPAPAPQAITSWSVDGSKSLREVVSKWTTASNVRLAWESASDVPVADPMRQEVFTGSLRDALGQLAARFNDIKTPLGMKFLENGTALRVYDLAPTP
jgi:hypothetical protein